MEPPQPPPPPVVETTLSSGVDDSQVGGRGVNADSCCVAIRKRGRQAKGVPKPTPAPSLKRQKDEEDVCFICFDGGLLVLCDRRGCPKAYHPACVKRDEAFFQSKAKWNCGWHICSNCEKTSHYMCYTCTYALCKGCTKTADFVCVRGNKGLCGVCMKTIKLIEDSAQGNKGEVDFDDKSSWEYLFKVYWVYLKGKLSLTFDEILRARNPWKGSLHGSCKVQTPRELYHLKVEIGSGFENSCIKIVIDSDTLLNKKFKIGDKNAHIWDVVLNDVKCNTQDLSTNCEPTGNICIPKNELNPSELAIDDSTNAGVAKLGVSGVSTDISSLLQSTGMKQQISDIVNDKSWHYEDLTGKVHGPVCMLQLCQWNAYRYFPPDLRIWRIGEKQDTSILLTDALSGKCSLTVSLPHNREQQSLGASATLDNKEKSQDGLSNATKSEICANSQVVEQSMEQKVEDMELDSRDGPSNATKSEICVNNQIVEQSMEQKVDDMERNNQDGLSNATMSEICANNQIALQSMEQKVDDKCPESHGKDESVRSNGWDSQSPCLTIQADRNNSEGLSGNFERREESSKCEISCRNGPQIYPSLPSSVFSEKLNENPSDKLTEGHGTEGNSEENGNLGSSRLSEGQSNSPSVFSEKLNENPSDKLTEGHGNEGHSEENGNLGSSRLSEGQSNSGPSDQKQPENEENSRQSSGQNWRVPEPDEILPPCNATSWLASIFGEPADDFGPLGDESVSDLLAEVEAMESLGGLESPTSMMKCGEELTDSSIADCLGFANGFSSMLDVGKADALSSTSDLHLRSQSTTPEEAFPQADIQLGFANGLSSMLDVGKGDALSSTSDLRLRSQSTTPEEPFPQVDIHHQTIHRERSSRTSEVESTFSRMIWNPTNQYSWDPNRAHDKLG